MKKICVITAARSEYGLLKWIMKDIDKSDSLSLDIIITGAHLSVKQGHTIDQIREDGFDTSNIIDVGECGISEAEIAQTMGRLATEIVPMLLKIKPDYVCVLGDRYELLPICNAAFVLGIPIIHLSGGDITEGSLDNGIRNAVSMLATYHFPGTEQSAQNIQRMIGDTHNIWNIGEPGLDAFFREEMMSRTELADNLGLDVNRKWSLLTYHPETTRDLDYDMRNIENIVACLLNNIDAQIVATFANADRGGDAINDYLTEAAEANPDRIIVIPSLGQKRYLSFMKQCSLVIGNSSSGIVEAPMLNVPVINVGDRQKGRYLCKNIIQCGGSEDELVKSIRRANEYHSDICEDRFYWGDGHTAEKFVKILENDIC